MGQEDCEKGFELYFDKLVQDAEDSFLAGSKNYANKKQELKDSNEEAKLAIGLAAQKKLEDQERSKKMRKDALAKISKDFDDYVKNLGKKLLEGIGKLLMKKWKKKYEKEKKRA